MHQYFEGATTKFVVNTDGDYVISDSAALTMTSSTETWTTLTTLFYASSLRTLTRDYYNTSDYMYYVSTVTYFNLTGKQSLSLAINLTCSISGAAVTHKIIPNGTDPIPSWVSIDEANNKLLVSIPAVSSITKYSFGIQSGEGIDRSTRIVSLTVIPCQGSS